MVHMIPYSRLFFPRYKFSQISDWKKDQLTCSNQIGDLKYPAKVVDHMRSKNMWVEIAMKGYLTQKYMCSNNPSDIKIAKVD